MKKSFTIIELLLYMGIFSVLITVIGGIFLDIMELQLAAHSSSEVSQNMNYMFTRLSHDVYSASSVSLPAAAGQTDQAMTLVISAQNYTYSLSGSNLVLTNPAGSYVLNTPDVSVIGFTVTRLGELGKPNILINISVRSNITPLNKAPQTASYSHSFTLK